MSTTLNENLIRFLASNIRSDFSQRRDLRAASPNWLYFARRCLAPPNPYGFRPMRVTIQRVGKIRGALPLPGRGSASADSSPVRRKQMIAAIMLKAAIITRNARYRKRKISRYRKH
jgi:hypothetical protein